MDRHLVIFQHGVFGAGSSCIRLRFFAGASASFILHVQLYDRQDWQKGKPSRGAGLKTRGMDSEPGKEGKG